MNHTALIMPTFLWVWTLGLLFIISGIHDHKHKILLSRFPTNNAISVDENNANLNVRFLERVFMKNRSSYKAAVYSDTISKNSFWDGKIVDRQINSSFDSSNYWIVDFLASDLKTTPASGTKRLANALKTASVKSGLAVKMEISAAVTLAKNLDGKNISIKDFCDRFNLSALARQAIQDSLKSPDLYHTNFRFTKNDFASVISVRAVELDNGGIMSAPAENFDKIFKKNKLGTDGKATYSTEGRVVNERLKTNC